MAPIQIPDTPSPAPIVGLATERRTAWLTPVLGLAGSVLALLLRRLDWAEGLLLGSGLAWLNFRWLRRGMNALVSRSASQEGRTKPQVPLITYLAAAFRYALLALGVYVSFIYLHVPLVSLIVGLCALGAAAIAAGVWEILRPAE
jgi:ATP synthase I chain